MSTKVYMSEVSPHWPIDRQKQALASVLDGALLFVDRLDRKQRQVHQAGSLIERERMTRQTSRRSDGDELHVASLAVLAWSEDDLREVLKAIEARGCTLHTHDGIKAAGHVATWIEARRMAHLRAASKRGGDSLGALKIAASRAACERIRERWERPTLPETSTAILLAEAGVSRNTANVYLKPRCEAQLSYQRREARRRRKSNE